MPRRTPTYSPFTPAQRAENRRAENARTDKKFLDSSRWRKLRRAFLRRNPVCVACKDRGEVRTATDVDHIVSRRDAPHLKLSMSNLQALCRSCHSAKTRREQNERRG